MVRPTKTRAEHKTNRRAVITGTGKLEGDRKGYKIKRQGQTNGKNGET